MRYLWVALLGGSLLSGAAAAQTGHADEVNPMIGTAGDGQTFPAVGLPFGMTNWSPQTRDGEAKCVSPYYEKDTKIQGFRASHWMSGSCTQDYGSATVMPVTGALVTDAEGRASEFQHAKEKMTPYRYQVTLDRYGVEATMAGTSRAGILEFRFEKPGPAWIVIQSNARKGEGGVKVDAARGEISGHNPAHRLYAGAGKPAGFSGYFAARFDRPFQGAEVVAGAGAPTAWARFDVKAGDVIRVKLGTSFTSADEARKNLDAEIPDWNLEKVATASHKAWDTALSRFEIVDSSAGRRRIFYTALYHSLLLPRAFSDASGTYPGFAGSGKTETARGFVYYCDFSLWDTFRSLHPLLTLVDPDRTKDMVQSLIAKGQQGGWLPIFPAWNSYTSEMVGDHAIVMITDAYVKGVRGFDVQEAYRLMRQNAMEQPKSYDEYVDGRGRRALESYLKYNYVPLEDPVKEAFHSAEQVSRTLEYSFDDFILSRFAAALGKKEDEAIFLKRAGWWANVVDPSVGFARGRHADGTWATPFDPGVEYRYVTEGLPFQYTFFVPQDIEGLIQRVGGREKFIAKLDTLFASKFYDHGNEPSHHIAYLYDYAGAPWKTQQQVRRIMDQQYMDRGAGMAGNDDAGQMSAWFVLSALGFYTVAPGTPVYQIGTPLFEQVTVRLPGGKTFRVEAKGASAGKFYIQSAKLNGKPLTRPWLKHEEVAQGGSLVFEMSDQPNKDWGARPTDAPPSLTKPR